MWLLLACSPGPQSIAIDGPSSVTVHSLDPIPLPPVLVLDSAGTALPMQPPVQWAATPHSVAVVEGFDVVPRGNGLATVTVSVEQALGDFTVLVQQPDGLRLEGYELGQPFRHPDSLQLQASVLAGEVVVEGEACAWASDDTSVAAVTSGGKLSARGHGWARLSCETGDLSAALDVVVGEAVKPFPELLEDTLSACQAHTRKAVNWQLQQMTSPSGAQAQWLREETAAALAAQERARTLLAHVSDPDGALAARVEGCDDG